MSAGSPRSTGPCGLAGGPEASGPGPGIRVTGTLGASRRGRGTWRLQCSAPRGLERIAEGAGRRPGSRGRGSLGARVLCRLLPAENYVILRRHECYAYNGTQRLVDRLIYNLGEYLRFDSDVGEFRAVSELGRRIAEYWNSQKDVLERWRASVETVCRHNYEINKAFPLERRVQPKVHVSPSKKGSLQHHDLLVCHVTDFYPGNIEVRWFLNGQEETAGVVATKLIRNGDWTFQILVMLEMTPKQGDVYTCHVEHPSLNSPVTVKWKAQSDSARNKTLTGVGGFVLGLIFLVVGVFMHKRRKKAQRGP